MPLSTPKHKRFRLHEIVGDVGGVVDFHIPIFAGGLVGRRRAHPRRVLRNHGPSVGSIAHRRVDRVSVIVAGLEHGAGGSGAGAAVGAEDIVVAENLMLFVAGGLPAAPGGAIGGLKRGIV